MTLKKIESMPRDYINVVYGDKPYTDYPSVLTKYLVERYSIKKNEILLDFGCGKRRVFKWLH